MALCPVCDTPSNADLCSQCGGAMVLGPGYKLDRLLGAGGQSRVYAARLQDGEPVAIKILSLSRVKDPKTLELFRRSAQVLVGLSHPGIAKLLGYFEDLRPHAALYCVVQELIPGDTLAKASRYDEASAKDVALRVLATLGYLHGLSPPVIHRDIKPSNLMRKPDGSIVLIDFDLVRDALRPEGGSTLSIGTPGFTPMEQYMGDATPATDLYALGVTIAVLLARKDPTQMRGETRLTLREHINVSDGFVRVLEKLTEPEPARRYQSAREVVDAIHAKPRTSSSRGPLFALAALVLAAAMAIMVGAMASRKASRAEPLVESPPVVQPVQEPPPIAERPKVTPNPIPPPSDPPRPSLALSGERDPKVLWAAIAPGTWQGQVEDRAMRFSFNGTQSKPKANIDGSTATVEFSGVGVITVKRRDKRADTTAIETYYLRVSSDHQVLTGTLETNFASGGSTYDTSADITLRRIP